MSESIYGVLSPGCSGTYPRQGIIRIAQIHKRLSPSVDIIDHAENITDIEKIISDIFFRYAEEQEQPFHNVCRKRICGSNDAVVNHSVNI